MADTFMQYQQDAEESRAQREAEKADVCPFCTLSKEICENEAGGMRPYRSYWHDTVSGWIECIYGPEYWDNIYHGASPMTFYDELVKLFRAETNLSEEVIQHLVALACERARDVVSESFDDWDLRESVKVEDVAWKVIAALGRVKRG